MPTDSEIHALHRYFIWADRMKVHFAACVARKTPKEEILYATSEEGIEYTLYMSYWYAATYVVVEGWRALGMTDLRVDRFLTSSNVQALKRYRNGVFHFQRNYYDKRFLEFQISPDSAPWIWELREALSDYFMSWIETRKGSSGPPMYSGARDEPEE